ncbi:MAG: exodeoxyribonuclease III [Bacteroidetes bacterium]|nr:exodeoxyribonuclease III [Bacteroidota bacterium]
MTNKFRILCWNVNGIRAIWKKGFPEWFAKELPDVLCIQETKAQPDQLDDEVKNFFGYKSYFFSAEKKGYSGVAIWTKHKPIRISAGFNNPAFDNEGRVLEMEFEKFILINVYFPNGGRGPERVKYKLDFYAELFNRTQELRKRQKNIIICGDYNTAHREIDLARPKENARTSGFLPEERAWMDKIISMDYIDIFREYNKDPNQYTYWDQITRARERNVGWRIDYYMVSKEARDLVVKATIHPDVMGSDHCPIGLELKM